MVFDCPSICSTKLSLGLGYYNNNTDRNVHIPQNHHHILDHGLGNDEDHDQKIKIKPRAASSAKSDLSSFPSLTLALQPSSEETLNLVVMDDTKGMTSDHHHSTTGQQGSSGSAVSSFSNSSSLKREIREVSGDNQEVFEEERISEKINGDGDQDEEGPRKKLRLTKEQSIILEDSFKVHSTLNPKQKQALANKLNLRPRQVEVWFQNRRARTKLKQTEVDFEILKKCCETLKEENKRLHKELQDLRVMKMVPPPPFYMQLPAATQTMCPSCETITNSGGGGGAAGEKSSKISLSIGAKPHFYSPFTNHPSAAC